LGEYEKARELNKETLARCWRVLGDDNPDTLKTAANLAVDLHRLGEYQIARELNEDILARSRQVFGCDDSVTVGIAENLARNLRELGEYEMIRTLLGGKDPDTTSTGDNVFLE
jgi:hypothetical protein